MKHSKYKNTGLIFELLVRQTTAGVLAGKSDNSAVKLLKKYFKTGTMLNKELKLYKTLSESYVKESRADLLINEVLKTREKMRIAQLKKEKYNLVKEISKEYNVNDFFRSNVPNYRTLASIYMLFEGENKLSPIKKIQCFDTIVETLTNKKTEKKYVRSELDDIKREPSEVQLITYKIMLERFNNKYDSLSLSQKNLLREYIFNVSNTNGFKEYVNKKIDYVKKQLTECLPKITDEVTSIKVKEITEHITNLKKGKVVSESQLSQLMQYMELVKEIKKVI